MSENRKFWLCWFALTLGHCIGSLLLSDWHDVVPAITSQTIALLAYRFFPKDSA